MAIELAKAYVQIIPTTNGITGMLNDELNGPAEEAGKEAGKKTGSGFVKNLGDHILSGAASITSAGLKAFEGIAKGTADMVKGIVNGAQATAQYGDNVDKMSQKIGISAESYQKWSYVMERAGTNVDMLQTSMKTLSNAAENNSKAFTALGISETEVANLSQEDLFGRVIEGLSGMEEGTERTAIASSLLGKAATELGPLLNEGTNAIAEQMQMAEEYGMVMSNEAVAASAVFQDSLTTMNNTFTGIKNDVFSQFLPSMTEITDGIALLASGSTEGLDLIAAGAGDFINNVASVVPELINVVSTVLPAVADTILQNAPMILEAGINLFTALLADENIWQIITMILSYIPVLINSITSKFGELTYIITDAGVKLFVALVANAPQMIIEIVKAIPQIIKSIVSALKDNWPIMKQAGLDLIKGLWQGISDAASWLWNLVRGWCSNLVGKIKGFFGIHSPSTLFAGIGDNLMLGLAGGIDDGADSVYSAIDRVTAATMGGINGSMTVNSALSMPEYQATSRMDEMISRLENLRIYLDGDTLVGGIAGRMDNTLGINSGLAERGLA